MTIEYSFDVLPGSLHSLLEMRADSAPEKTFAIFEGRETCYGELARDSLAFAARLCAQGVTSGDRVLSLMPSSEFYLGLWFAISRLGAIECPINPAYKGVLLRQLVETSQPSLCIVDSGFVDEFIRSSGDLVPADRIVTPEEFLLLPQAPELPMTRMEARDTAAIIFTSGTTGRSKGVMTSHRQQLAFGQAFAEITGLTAGDTSYNFLPFFHIAAKFVALGTMLAGGRMLLRASFSVSNFWPDVRRHGATVCSAVGGLCHMLQSQPPSSSDSDNPMRMIYAVPVPWEFKEDFERRFGLTLVEGYGGTESNLVAYSRPEENTPRGSCGRPSPHFQIEIQDSEGKGVAAGEAGEICIRPRYPATMMNGYFNMPDKTVETIADLWFHTGDRGYLSSTGYLFFLDRLKDSIRRRGENISSFEVERILNGHESVAESAVVPVPSEMGEDEVKAFVVLKPGKQASAEELFRYAGANMAYFMVPRFIELREELPRTPTMKVKKADLRAEGNGTGTWDCEAAGLRVTRSGLVSLLEKLV